jgi:nucleoside-diphosphate-sugar epimerase
MQTVAGHGWERGSKWNRGPIRVEDGPAPRNHYALTKVWAEMMGQMYAHSYGLSVIGVRIGWFARDLATANRLAASQIGTRIYLSHGDAQRFFARCVESPTPAPGEYVTLFATSQPPTEPLLDLEPAHRIIGYAPQDTWAQGLPFDYPNPSSSI